MFIFSRIKEVKDVPPLKNREWTYKLIEPQNDEPVDISEENLKSYIIFIIDDKPKDIKSLDEVCNPEYEKEALKKWIKEYGKCFYTYHNNKITIYCHKMRKIYITMRYHESI